MLHEPGDFLTPEVLSASPLCFEIGCGHGEFIEREAKANPDRFYIGIENVPYYALSAAKRVQQANLTNTLILNQNANRLLDTIFPDSSLDTIYILYPDPWPKRRHRKRRLVRAETYERFHQVLVPGGQIKIWTDAVKWVELSAPFLEKLPGELVQKEVTDSGDASRTLFERKAASKGHKIYYLEYRKP